MNFYLGIEISCAILSLLYVILMMRQNIWCWICGILSSALYIISCIHTKIYLEGGLNLYYIIVGFYGWYHWLHKSRSGVNHQAPTQILVSKWKPTWHILNIAICILLVWLLGFWMHRLTDSPRPYFDATLTVFAFSATILEARKILSAWVYWIIINAATIILMYDRGMHIYAALYIIMAILSVKGYFDWQKSYQENAERA